MSQTYIDALNGIGEQALGLRFASAVPPVDNEE